MKRCCDLSFRKLVNILLIIKNLSFKHIDKYLIYLQVQYHTYNLYLILNIKKDFVNYDHNTPWKSPYKKYKNRTGKKINIKHK